MIIDCHNHIGVDLGLYGRGEFPYAQHAETLARQGEPLGITRWIVFPMVAHLALNFAALRAGRVTAEGAFERVPYAWENRRLMQEVYEFFPALGRVMLPFAMFDAARETALQARELRALREKYRFYGLKTQTTMTESPITHLRNEGGVFLDLAREWDIPLLIHSSVIESDIWAQARDIIDIAADNANVRFCIAHSCRFDRPQLERIAALPNCWFDCSAHGIHCQLARENNPVVAPLSRRFTSDYAQPAKVLWDMARAFPGKLLWGSDSPFYSFIAQTENEQLSLLSSYEQEVEFFMALPEEMRKEIAEHNTLRFLGIEL